MSFFLIVYVISVILCSPLIFFSLRALVRDDYIEASPMADIKVLSLSLIPVVNTLFAVVFLFVLAYIWTRTK